MIKNVNVGVLGHVDSGKTSLCKALSTVASTAAFDKSPISQSKGITIDLGFSSTIVSSEEFGSEPLHSIMHPNGTKSQESEASDRLQLTFVDCPGHSSLIRTIVGGATIIDVMFIVIDAVEGIQTQTAECMVIAEILNKPILIVINKVDALKALCKNDPVLAEERLEKLKKKINVTFRKNTRWPLVDIVAVSAAPRSDVEAPNASDDKKGFSAPQNVKAIIPAVLNLLLNVQKEQEKVQTSANVNLAENGVEREQERFLMLVDHCFSVKGQGTVFTGTVMAGRAQVGDQVLLPELQLVKKIKSLQVFKKGVNEVNKGDRCGLAVTQFDAELMERGVLCGTTSASTDATHTSSSDSSHFFSDVWLAEVHRVRHHTPPMAHLTKYHVRIGHTTVMATMRFFHKKHVSTQENVSNNHEKNSVESPFDFQDEGYYLESLQDESCFYHYKAPDDSTLAGIPLPIEPQERTYYAVLFFEKPIYIFLSQNRKKNDSGECENPFLAMRLDMERENICRIAMGGNILCPLLPSTEAAEALLTPQKERLHERSQRPHWRNLNVIKYKNKELFVDRVVDGFCCVASGLISDEVSSASTGEKQNNRKTKEKDHEKKKGAFKHSEVQKFIGFSVIYVPTTLEGKEIDVHRLSEEFDDLNERECVLGVIDSAFGQTGKIKLKFKSPIFDTISEAEKDSSKRNSMWNKDKGKVLLRLKKYPFSMHSSLKQ